MAAEGDLLQSSVLLQGWLAVSLHVLGSSERRHWQLGKCRGIPWRASPIQDLPSPDVLLLYLFTAGAQDMLLPAFWALRWVLRTVA